MDNIEISGPVIHIVVPLIAAFIFRLNRVIAIFCGILPDLVDKPLGLLGIGGGRYIGHTLLFALFVSIGFFFWRKRYSLAAIVGLGSHLLLDLPNVPWFYPFKDYYYIHKEFDFAAVISGYFTINKFGYELLVVAIIVIIVFVGWRLYIRCIKNKKADSDS